MTSEFVQMEEFQKSLREPSTPRRPSRPSDSLYARNRELQNVLKSLIEERSQLVAELNSTKDKLSAIENAAAQAIQRLQRNLKDEQKRRESVSTELDRLRGVIASSLAR